MKKKFLMPAGMTALILSLTACGNGEDIGALMINAGLNTLIGMGTVFIVLILISLLISCFGFIPRIQAALSKEKKEEPAAEQTAAAQAVETVDGTDDLELAAVIAAAVAAYEGAAGTDGFVVRSIIRRM